MAIVLWYVQFVDRRNPSVLERDDANRQIVRPMYQTRWLYLDRTTLSSYDSAAIDIALQDTRPGRDKKLLPFRRLFQEVTLDKVREITDQQMPGVQITSVANYLEDETGTELSRVELARAVTGIPDVIAVPEWTPDFVIEYYRRPDEPWPVSSLPPVPLDMNVLGQFTRDLNELLVSAFMSEGSGVLTVTGQSGERSLPSSGYALKTAATDEEIRSFVTIFRRLYMVNEPAHFLKAVEVFNRIVGSHRASILVNGWAECYRQQLGRVGHWIMPFAPNATFDRKRLIDVFLYTQYAHQQDSNRERQYRECLEQVNRERDLLFFLFLQELHQLAQYIANAGSVIEWAYRSYSGYCMQSYGYSPTVLPSISNSVPGIGTLEKQNVKNERLLAEKAQRIAASIWKERGCPEGGPEQFIEEARTGILSSQQRRGGE